MPLFFAQRLSWSGALHPLQVTTTDKPKQVSALGRKCLQEAGKSQRSSALMDALSAPAVCGWDNDIAARTQHPRVQERRGTSATFGPELPYCWRRSPPSAQSDRDPSEGQQIGGEVYSALRFLSFLGI